MFKITAMETMSADMLRAQALLMPLLMTRKRDDTNGDQGVPAAKVDSRFHPGTPWLSL